MKPLLFILLISILGCNSSSSQSQTKLEQPTMQQLNVTVAVNYIDTFFKKYKQEGTAKAIDYIFSFNPSLVNVSQLTDLKSKLDSTRNLLGNFDSQELITQKSISNSLVLFSYLVKHEKQPIRFTFIFYKPKNDWTLYKFKFDDQADTELEEASKIYFIK